MSAGVVARGGVFDAPENFVPSNNQELVQAYGPYVAKLVMRHNRVTSNYADLLQHIWLKLIEADVLGKYSRSLGHLPKTLTAHQACTYLRMPWTDFMGRVHAGVMEEARHNRVQLRDGGLCCRCVRNMDTLSSSLREVKAAYPDHYAVVAVGICEELGLEEVPDRLWVIEEYMGQDKTTCLYCARNLKISGVSYKWYPTPHKGHWTKPNALYLREDIERLRLVLETENDRPVDVSADPSSVLSKSLFKQYLARAVHNFYANWCRTRDRRYKENYKGYDETTGRHWEETLCDSFGTSQETFCDLSTTINYLAGGGDPDEASDESKAEVITLIESGKSAQEVARRQGIRPKALQAMIG